MPLPMGRSYQDEAPGDYTMIYFLAEKYTQLEVLFVHGRLKGRRRAFLMNLMEGYVSAAAARDNEENVFFFKRRPNGPLAEVDLLEKTVVRIGMRHRNTIIVGHFPMDFDDAELAEAIASRTSNKDVVEDLLEGIEDPPPTPLSDRERQLIVSLREKPIDPDLSSSPKEGQR